MNNQPNNIRQTSINLSNHERHAEERDYHVRPTVLEVKLKFTQRNDRYTVDYEILKDLNILRIDEIVIAVDDGGAYGCRMLVVYPANYGDRCGGTGTRFSEGDHFNGRYYCDKECDKERNRECNTHRDKYCDKRGERCNNAFNHAYDSNSDLPLNFSDKDVPRSKNENSNKIHFLVEGQNEYNYNKQLKDTKHDGERMAYNSIFPYYSDKPVLDINLRKNSDNDENVNNGK